MNLVLVHGTGGDPATNYGHLVDGFADVRHVITPDYSQLTGELSVDQLASHVTADLPDEPYDLVGFSLGAVVAAAIAAGDPARVRRLVLIAGWVDNSDFRLHLGFSTWARLAATDPTSFAAFGPLVAFSPAFVSAMGEDATKGTPPPGTVSQIELDARVDIRDRLPLITAPTLVVGCSQDHLVPVSNARALHEGIAGSSYAELDSGHVVLLERPAEITTLIRDFILS
ncbi:alpha/beta fold hydrolase [Nonomuraea roseola]|uniref:Alpha/beta fold hydrolase n=1 Tax=Nonomuraea roseola TaxID=46179 RepID=A0ABV5Q1W5_9ACTN